MAAGRKMRSHTNKQAKTAGRKARSPPREPAEAADPPARAQTIKQAKAAYRARTAAPKLSWQEVRRLQRLIELDARKEVEEEKERKRKAATKKRTQEQNRGRLERRQRRRELREYGIPDRVEDRLGRPSSQTTLASFVRPRGGVPNPATGRTLAATDDVVDLTASPRAPSSGANEDACGGGFIRAEDGFEDA